MLLTLEVRVRLFSLLEAEHFVDDWLELMGGNEAVHLFETDMRDRVNLECLGQGDKLVMYTYSAREPTRIPRMKEE